jgi:hypothetical protein
MTDETTTIRRPCGESLNAAADVLIKLRCLGKFFGLPELVEATMTLNTQEYHQKVWEKEEFWCQQELGYMIKAVREDGN